MKYIQVIYIWTDLTTASENQPPMKQISPIRNADSKR